MPEPESPFKLDKDFQDLFLRSPLGPKVLGKMLDSCHFGAVAQDEEWQAAQNFMKIVLVQCGISYTGEKMVRCLMPKKGEFIGDDDNENN